MASSLPLQISSAIAIALNPAPAAQAQRHEAHLFLTQVKEASSETWQACLGLFLEEDDGGAKKWGNQERMFGAQVVGESLPSLAPEALAFVQSSLFDYFAREYVNCSAESGVAFLKNASIHLATLLFAVVYPATTPQFFDTFISLIRQYSPSTVLPVASSSSSPLPPLNPATTDLLLRLLHEISTEISDATLRLNKSGPRMARDGLLRDSMRERHAGGIANVIWEILAEALDGVDAPDGEGKVGLKGKGARAVAEMAMVVVGDYVSWIDINLMVTPTTIPLLLGGIHLPGPSHTAIRIATADAILETVTKGMPPSDKLALLTVLDLGTVLSQLIDVGRAPGAQATAEIELLREKLAKVLNGVGAELCKITEEALATPEEKVSALALATTLLPLLLRFLADKTDDIASAVFPFAGAILSVYKKEKKRALGAQAERAGMTTEKRAFLIELLRVALGKMEYGKDVEWEMSVEGDEDEDQVAFAELRKSLKIIVDGVAWIDPELYSEAARSIVIATLDTYAAGGAGAAALQWQRIELTLYLVYGFGSTQASAGPGAFVQVPPLENQRAKRESEYRIDYTQFPLSVIGEMLLKTCRSKVVEYSHPAVSLQFFEIIVRYHDFFKLCPEYIPQILPSFLDEHGLHQPDEAVQARVFYLFSRFIYSAKTIIQAQVSGELVSNILARMQDLLVVRAVLTTETLSDEALTKAAGTPSSFDSQLYLFESVGTLISILNQIPQQQVVLLRAALTPLLSGLQSNMRTSATTPADFDAVFQAHHLMMAVGNVAKGFPDLSGRSPTATGLWVGIFKEATEVVLTVAKAMGGFVIIRDAARFAFNRIVATTGEVVLPLIPALIDCLIGQVTFPELADLLSFLGLLVAKYKDSFRVILDTLLMPVFNRVFYFLKLPITGTDDTFQHSQLRRAYFSLILAMAAANLQDVLYSEKNKPHLQDILQSVTHYIGHDSLAADQKIGFGVLNKLVTLWVTNHPSAPPPAVVPGHGPSGHSNGISPVVTVSPVPGFEQFLYSQAVGLCFELPLKKDFDFTDAQSNQVLNEISSLLKALLVKRGTEFSQFMSATLLPSIQCPSEAAVGFMTALQQANDGKQFKKYAAEWLKSCRGLV